MSNASAIIGGAMAALFFALIHLGIQKYQRAHEPTIDPEMQCLAIIKAEPQAMAIIDPEFQWKELVRLPNGDWCVN